MSDTTSTPEPEGRGAVATGGAPGPATTPAAGPSQTGSTDEGVTEEKAVPAGGGDTPQAAAEPAQPTAAPPAPVGSGSAAPAEAGDEPTVADLPVAKAEPATDAPAVTTQAPVDTPTATVERPLAPNGARSHGSNGHPSYPGQGPRPTPGPVPGPGPAAAAPPPWNRVPGQEHRDAGGGPNGSVGGLLDDGPTVIMSNPSQQDASAAEQSGQGQSGTGGWQAVRATRNRTPRQAALQLKRLDPWSVLKLALVLAVVLFFIWLVAVGVLYGVLDGMGVWDRLNGTYADLVSGEAPTGSPLISAGRVFGLAAVVGAINSLLFAVAMTIGAFVYNVSADLVGGIEVTLSERD